jgi:hypothetical protein
LIVKRALSLAAAIAAVAAAAGVCVVAASYAVFALARVWLGPAGAAAVVAAIFALVAVIVAAVALGRASPRDGKAAESPMERALGLARERPIAAVAAAAVAAAALITISVRNPGALTAIISALVAGNAARPRK